MPTQLQNSKKTLCCTGFTVQKAATSENIKDSLTANFMNAAIAFIASASTIVGETIPNPLPIDADNPTKVLVTCGTLSDAMGRLIGGAFPLPVQDIIDELTKSEEAIIAG
jgi:hypothetical protein